MGIPVILGSATPDVQTFKAAQDGDLRYIHLSDRATGAALSEVQVVDMRQELKTGNRSMFSRRLQLALGATLGRNEQALLFLNRRGSASVVVCRDCGYKATCKRCDTVLSYHAASELLICHRCNARQASPSTCPQCAGSRIRYLGVGTERVVQEAEALLPNARIGRLDSDISGGRRGYEKVLRAFENREYDVLVGTQLLSKGLDVPNVSLVGVVNADIGLYLPEFRSGERTFQTLTQVAGRAGRRSAGLTIVQTYSPDHYVIRAAARQDYFGFYESEIRFREANSEPPFTRVAKLVYQHYNDAVAERETERLAAVLRGARATAAHAIEVLGPAPAYVRRLRGRYRWQVVLRGADLTPLLDTLSIPPGWLVDVDPISVL